MLVGRIAEQRELRDAFESEYSEFVAVYGRHRVGKTFLVRETFNYNFTFEHSGVANAPIRMQLKAFRDSLVDAGMKKLAVPSDWMEAFTLLRQLIRQSDNKKKTIFIDEIPWMDTPRSNFVSALEYFWNSFASARKDVLLIICGSATSWIINKVLKNHGGLHNRVTHRISVQPFNLSECEEYLHTKGMNLSRYDVLELYMVLGGIPFYWSMLNKGESVAQNIDALLFSEKGKLHNEFNELYHSLFKSPEHYIDVVENLGASGMGMTRDEIIKSCRLEANGNTTRILDDLQECEFIKKIPTYRLKNQATYILIDNFTLFYLKFLKKRDNNDERYWSHSYMSPLRTAWVGLAFERVCFQHLRQIKMALGIEGVVTNVYSWRAKPDKDGHRGAQIDMLIDRADNMVNLCEMKFSKNEYVVTKDDAQAMSCRAERFILEKGSGKSVNQTMITVNGIAHSGYWSDVHSVVTADDLFKNTR